jgi:hypothetical protein
MLPAPAYSIHRQKSAHHHPAINRLAYSYSASVDLQLRRRPAKANIAQSFCGKLASLETSQRINMSSTRHTKQHTLVLGQSLTMVCFKCRSMASLTSAGASASDSSPRLQSEYNRTCQQSSQHDSKIVEWPATYLGTYPPLKLGCNTRLAWRGLTAGTRHGKLTPDLRADVARLEYDGFTSATCSSRVMASIQQ